MEDLLIKEGVLPETVLILKREGFKTIEDFLILTNDSLKNLGFGLQQILKVMKVVKTLRGDVPVDPEQNVGKSIKSPSGSFRSPLLSPTRAMVEIASIKASRKRHRLGSSKVSEDPTNSISSMSTLRTPSEQYREQQVPQVIFNMENENTTQLKSMIPPRVYIVRPVQKKEVQRTETIEVGTLVAKSHEEESISRDSLSTEELTKLLHIDVKKGKNDESDEESKDLPTPRNEEDVPASQKYNSLNIVHQNKPYESHGVKENLPLSGRRNSDDHVFIDWPNKRHDFYKRSASVKSFASMRSTYSSIANPNFAAHFVREEMRLPTHRGFPCVIIDLDRVDRMYTEGGCMYIRPKLLPHQYTPLIRFGIPDPLEALCHRSRRRSQSLGRRSFKGMRKNLEAQKASAS